MPEIHAEADISPTIFWKVARSAASSAACLPTSMAIRNSLYSRFHQPMVL